MPDITMCMSDKCPKKYTCYRYKVKPDKAQSYSDFIYLCNESSKFCDYIKMNEEEC